MTSPRQWVAQFMATAPVHADTIEALTSSTDWEDFCWIANAILNSTAVVEAGLPADQVSLSRVVDSSMVIDSLYLDVYAPTLEAYLMVFIAVEDISIAPRETTGVDAAVGYTDVVMTKLAELGAAYRRTELADALGTEQASSNARVLAPATERTA